MCYAHKRNSASCPLFLAMLSASFSLLLALQEYAFICANLSFFFSLSGEISFQSGHQSNLYHFLEGLTRAFCNISYGFQDTLFQACKNDILEGRPRCFCNFFNNQNDYSEKFSSVPWQYLCGEYTRKTGLKDPHNFKSLRRKFELSTSAPA